MKSGGIACHTLQVFSSMYGNKINESLWGLFGSNDPVERRVGEIIL
jgi:hypothetical protein